MHPSMSHVFRFDPLDLPPAAATLRRDVRAFLRSEIAAGTFEPGTCNYLMDGSANADFSRRLGERGWIGRVAACKWRCLGLKLRAASSSGAARILWLSLW